MLPANGQCPQVPRVSASAMVTRCLRVNTSNPHTYPHECVHSVSPENLDLATSGMCPLRCPQHPGPAATRLPWPALCPLTETSSLWS